MQPEQDWPSQKLTIEILNKIKSNGPTLVVDKDSIASQYQALQASLSTAKIHYAVKCNPEKEILKVIKDQGGSFEIASEFELERLIQIGVNPKDVIFSNTIKIPKHIENTFNKGLHRYAVDSPGEIKKVAEKAPGSEVYFRVQVSNHGSVIPLSSKFGAHPSHIIGLMQLATDFGLKPIGLAFHVGSQAENVQLWDRAFEIIGAIYKEASELDIELSILNIGGGFPVRYAMDVPSVEEIGKSINRNIKEHKLESLELWTEPGRFLVAEAGVLITNVIGRETRGGNEWIYLDVGRFNGLAELFESEELRYPVVSSKDLMQNNSRLLKEVTLTGPSCDSFDTIFHGVPINATVNLGDRLYFGTAGAYTTVYASSFNDFAIPKIKYV